MAKQDQTKAPVTIFGGEYNAKGAMLEGVAETFVPPEGVFDRLIQQNNTLLIGPRGSGKTTLLRMLQGPGLELWRHPMAEEARAAIRYSGVFVPADRAWAEQLQADDVDGTVAREFAVATFTIHCLRALVRTATERAGPSANGVSHRRVSLDPEEARHLARAVAKAWGVGRPVADLTDLRFALTEAVVSLGEARSLEGKLSAKGREERLARLPLFHLSFSSAAIAFIERFNHLADDPEGHWAFLFDEVELVPGSVEKLLLRYLRGSDERLLFKVSYAPYERDEEFGTFHGPLGAQPGQDYSVLRLTYANKRDGFPFSQALFEAELARKRIELAPERVLGPSSVIVGSEDDDEDGTSTALDYGPDGSAVKLLESLSERDQTFRAYLERTGVDIYRLNDLSENERARIRKIMPLVAARLEYQRPPEARWRRIRGRQNIELYAGVEAFYAMMEANPRWLKHVTDRLVNGASRVDNARQTQVLREAAREFSGYLSILPMGDTDMRLDDGPKQLMKRIGRYFLDHYHRQPFNPDAPGSVRIDRDFPETVMNSLRALVNRGALIPVPEPDDADLTTPLGKRFRLAYLQAPLYGLPLRLDRAVRLSEILSVSPAGQMTLEDPS